MVQMLPDRCVQSPYLIPVTWLIVSDFLTGRSGGARIASGLFKRGQPTRRENYMKMSHARWALLGLGMTALLVTSCGSSSSKTTTGTTTASSAGGSSSAASQSSQGTVLTQAKFVARADAICARAKVRRKQIKVKNSVELELALPQAAAYQRLESIEFSKLTPPASMASDWHQIVADSQTITATIVKLYEGARANEPTSAGTPLWNTLSKSSEQIQSIARRNGLRACLLVP